MNRLTFEDLLNMWGGKTDNRATCTALQNYLNQFGEQMTDAEKEAWAEEYIKLCMS